MLQQILRDLWVDPAILAELDDEQRQTLFCKMREEQVRRWRIWDAATVIPNRKPSAPGAKTVQFLAGKDGEPWVWVMGEHPDDLSVDEILEREAREKARKQAELEAEELRKKVEDELSELLDQNERQINSMDRNVPISSNESPPPPPLPPRQISPPPLIESLMNDHEDIYCSVDELRAKSKLMRTPVEDEIHDKTKKPVSERVAQWERRLLEERTAEILGRMRRRRMDSVREAEETAAERERLWQEQEKKAKEAEIQIREIARRAREEHRRASILDKNTESSTIIQPTPPSSNGLSAVQAACIAAPMGRDAVCKWFWSSEVPRGAAIGESGKPEPWFHGLISRHEAESLLEGKLKGTFLVRVSERIRGYVISYRDWKCCKHFLVDCSGPFYQFLGAGQIGHHSLSALVRHHRDRPITQIGGERLQSPCVCSDPPEILRIRNLNI